MDFFNSPPNQLGKTASQILTKCIRGFKPLPPSVPPETSIYPYLC